MGVGSDPSWPWFQASGPLTSHGGRDIHAGAWPQGWLLWSAGPWSSRGPSLQREAAAGQGPGAEAVPGTLEVERVHGAPGEGQGPQKPRCSNEVLGSHTANSPSGEAGLGLQPMGASQTPVSCQRPADSSAQPGARGSGADGRSQTRPLRPRRLPCTAALSQLEMGRKWQALAS